VNRNADFFLQNESIRIDSHNESNRVDSNRELECSSIYTAVFRGIMSLSCVAIYSGELLHGTEGCISVFATTKNDLIVLYAK